MFESAVTVKYSKKKTNQNTEHLNENKPIQ